MIAKEKKRLTIGGDFLVTIQKTELKEGISKAIEKAKNSSASILMSDIQKIDMIDPLTFFYAGKEKYRGERFFWKHPSQNKYLVGLGTCEEIVTNQGADRFFHVEKKWKQLIEQAVINNTEDHQGTGPVAFGCFSFDPLKEKTSLWSHFSAAVFRLPKFMLSIIDNQAFLTTNVICNSSQDPDIYIGIEKERQKLLTRAAFPCIKYDEVILNDRMDVRSEEWLDSVKKVVQDLKKGPLKKVVLARELRLFFNEHVHIESALNRLLSEQLDSYVFAMESNEDCFIGATPERLVRKEQEHAFSACLAGSTARGHNEEEDTQLGEALLKDDKNRIEHQYVVNVIRQAMEETCHEVKIPSAPQLLKLKHIQHLYTPVIGTLDQHISILSLVEKLHPTPALGGFPKEEAKAKIREVEALDRGLYAGPIGWLDYRGNGDFAVAIRSGLIQGNEASIFAGCGIVEDSVAQFEFEETNIKFKPMLSALGGLKQ